MKQFGLLLLGLLTMIQVNAQTWSLVWADEFNDAVVDPANWTFETGGNGWGNNELQYYTGRTENANTENGNLQIIAKDESYGGNNYTSARMITKDKQSFTYGKIEARIKNPLGKGYWSAFWMLGQNISEVGWPNCGEIDILEHVNSEAKTHGTIHWDNNGHANYGGEINSDQSTFHTYGVEWNDTVIKWFLDGNKYWEANILDNINSTDEFHSPFFIILNLAVGGTWPGSPDGTTQFPDTLFVDYVRVYQLSSSLPDLTISISSSNGSSICLRDSTELTTSGAGDGTYEWTPTEGLLATDQTTVIAKPTITTTYTVTGTDNGRTGTATQLITVNALPVVIASTNTTTICAGEPLTLTGSGASSYVWSDGIIDRTAFNPSISKTYTVTGTDDNNCSDTHTLLITVNTLPIVAANTINDTICTADTLILYGTGASSYSWSDGITDSVAFTPSFSKTYTVTGTDLNNCINSDTIIIGVNSNPIVSVATTKDTICYGDLITLTATGANSFSWTHNVTDGVSFAPDSSATYIVEGTNTSGCSNTASQRIDVIDCDTVTSISINKFSTSLEKTIIMPNPNSGDFIIQSNFNGDFKIINHLGQNVAGFELNNSNNQFTFNNFKPGIYFIIGINKGNMVREKIVVVK